MNASILTGPLLGFEQGDIYTVCLLLAPAAQIPVLTISSLPAPIEFRKKSTVAGNDFWRAEFSLDAGITGRYVSYQITVDGATCTDRNKRDQWTFYVPGAKEQPLIGYTSCNGFSTEKLARDNDQPYYLWEQMVTLHSQAPYALLLMGGDQVYADEIWESRRCPSLRKWNALSWKKQHAAKVSHTMRREIAAFYDNLYPERWASPAMSLMLASVPSVMMWDDHDIFDGWGSFPEERQNCDVFQAVYAEARRTFEIFQLRGGVHSRLNAAAPHFSLGLKFRDYYILSLDNRSERTLEHIMSEQHWRDVKAWLDNLSTSPIANLVVMSGVPVAYRSFARVEALMESTPWHEELEDDVFDHWSARSHEAERMRFIMVLLNFLVAQKSLSRTPETARGCKGVLLSGDVHVGAVGQVWWDRNQVGLLQVISSGIVHPPPSAFAWAGIQLMTSDDPQSLGEGEVTSEMLTPLGAPRYLRTRNFATIQTGTDHKLWVNWVCEKEKLNPSFAWS